MKGKFRFVLLASAVLSLTSCEVPEFLKGIISIEDSDSYSGDEAAINGYYSGYNLSLSGGRLILELQRNCWEKHKNYVSYGQFNSYCAKTPSHDSIEAITSGSGKNQWFYTAKESTGYGTREHVWPCANSSQLWTHFKDSNTKDVHNVDLGGSNKEKYVGGGSDLLHVRTCNSAVNTARGNSKFVDFDDPEFDGIRSDTYDYGESSGKYKLKIQGYETTSSGTIQYASKAEPVDEMKGDVARIVLYVWLHYSDLGITPEGSVKSGDMEYKYTDMVGQLELTNIMGYETNKRCLEVLKAWNKLDKPSGVEKLRNDTVQKIQGNRNPFVDHPELVDELVVS